VGCFFTLLVVFFTQKFLNLIWPHISGFAFIACILVSCPRNHCQIQCHESLPLRCRCLIHFELIFYMISGKSPTLLFCMWTFSFPSTICWKDCLLPIERSWHFCLKVLWDVLFFH
jgi:hypothetical protein